MLYCFRRCSGALGRAGCFLFRVLGFWLRRMVLALWVAATRRSGRYLCFWILCRMYLRVARRVLVDGGQYRGGSRLSRAESPLHDNHHTFTICHCLHAHSFGINQSIVVEGVVTLQIPGFGAVHLRVRFDLVAGTVAYYVHCRCADMTTAPLAVAAGDGKRSSFFFFFILFLILKIISETQEFLALFAICVPHIPKSSSS